MSDTNPSVSIIDDDPAFRDSVARLLRTVGLHAREFSSAPEFLKAAPPDGPTCLVLDVRMPGRSGLEHAPSARSLGSWPARGRRGGSALPAPRDR